MATRDPNVATRKIYFYRVDVGRDQQTQRRLPFNSQTLDALGQLSFQNGSAYLEEEDQVTCAWVDRPGPRARLRVADIRRENLPQLEQGGGLGPLSIGVGAGLAEQVHIAFYENNIVGSEFNFYGPRIGRVGRYLRDKAGLTPITFEMLIRRNVVDQLNQLRDIRLFQLRISPSNVDELSRIDASVADMFRNALTLGDVGRVEVILRPVPYSRQPLPARIRIALRALAGRSEILEVADVFKTAGLSDDGRVRGLDLLKDELVVEREVRRLGDGSRALDQSSVYDAIDGAYEELRSELENAPGAQEE